MIAVTAVVLVVAVAACAVPAWFAARGQSRGGVARIL